MLPVIFEPIQRLDPGRPLEALSLPGWLTCCVNSLGADYLNPEIPSELALSEEQRAAVAVRLDELALAEIACDVDHTMAVVVDLLEAFPAAKLSPDQVRSKAKGYIIALEDTPTWSVFEAARRWPLPRRCLRAIRAVCHSRTDGMSCRFAAEFRQARCRRPGRGWCQPG